MEVCVNLLLLILLLPYGSAAYPNLILECPESDIREHQLFNCTCRQTSSSSLLTKITLVYGWIRVDSALPHVTANFWAWRGPKEVRCEAKLPNGTVASVKKKLNIALKPTITRFEANKYDVDINSNVSFTCQADGKPLPHLSLTKDGQEIAQYSDLFQNVTVELTFIWRVRECNDSGVFVCLAQTYDSMAKSTVKVNAKCAYQLADTETQNTVYRARVNTQQLIVIRVFGYPRPSLQLEGLTNTLDENRYELPFLKDIPPYVGIIIHIYEVFYQVFQNYTLSITNSEGILVYNFSIVEDVEGEPLNLTVEGDRLELNVGGLAGGIVTGILVITAAIILIVVLKRKGILRRYKIDRNKENTPSQPPEDMKGFPKQNNLQEPPVKDVTPDTRC